MKFTYVWDHGYEKLDVEYDLGGSSHFAGSFHPVEGLCIGNPCDYCGMVWQEETASAPSSPTDTEGGQ